MNLVVVYVDQGRLDDAVRQLEQAGFPAPTALLVARALSGHATPEVAASVLSQSARADPTLGPVQVAQAYSRAGLIDSAFAALEVAARLKPIHLVGGLTTYPWLEPLRRDPRYADLVRRIGLR